MCSETLDLSQLCRCAPSVLQLELEGMPTGSFLNLASGGLYRTCYEERKDKGCHGKGPAAGPAVIFPKAPLAASRRKWGGPGARG